MWAQRKQVVLSDVRILSFHSHSPLEGFQVCRSQKKKPLLCFSSSFLLASPQSPAGCWSVFVWVKLTGLSVSSRFSTKWVIVRAMFKERTGDRSDIWIMSVWKQLFYCSSGWYFSHPPPRWDHVHLCSVSSEACAQIGLWFGMTWCDLWALRLIWLFLQKH